VTEIRVVTDNGSALPAPKYGGDMADEAVPIAYTALQPGTPCQSSDGEEFGTVEAVLAVEDMDVFDGIVVATAAGKRFVDADHVGQIFTTHVVSTLSAEEAAHLPLPDADVFHRIRPETGLGSSLASTVGRILGRRRR
jgi:hypothetical protein